MMSFTVQDYETQYWPKLENAIRHLLTTKPSEYIPISYEQMYTYVAPLMVFLNCTTFNLNWIAPLFFLYGCLVISVVMSAACGIVWGHLGHCQAAVDPDRLMYDVLLVLYECIFIYWYEMWLQMCLQVCLQAVFWEIVCWPATDHHCSPGAGLPQYTGVKINAHSFVFDIMCTASQKK